MVGIVLVSHSKELSEAVKALADQQIHGRATIVAVGGSDNPFQPFGRPGCDCRRHSRSRQ